MAGIRSIFNWFNEDEQEFMRREAQRTRLWLTRGRGAAWVAGYFALLLVQSYLVATVSPNAPGYGSLGSVLWTTLRFSWVFSLPSGFALWAWVHALRSRTIAPLRQERGRELILTNLEGKHLWPALLLAPLGLRLTMAAVSSAAGMATFGWWLWTGGAPDSAPSAVEMMAYRGYAAFLNFAIFAAHQAAATGWAARLMVPGGNVVRTAGYALLVALGLALLDSAMIFLSQAAFFMRLDLFFPLNLRDPHLLLPYHLAFLPGVIVRIAVFGWLFLMALRSLRSSKTTEKWRRSLEA